MNRPRVMTPLRFATATALLVLGCESPVSNEARPVYRLSLLSADPPAGTPFRPGQFASLGATVGYFFSKPGQLYSGCGYCAPVEGCTYVPDQTRESAPASLSGQVTLATTCTVPVDAERLRLYVDSTVPIEAGSYSDLGPSVVVEYPIQR